MGGDTLVERMRAHDQADEFAPHIEALESIDSWTPIIDLLGIWARARKAWCQVTGESLV